MISRITNVFICKYHNFINKSFVLKPLQIYNQQQGFTTREYTPKLYKSEPSKIMTCFNLVGRSFHAGLEHVKSRAL